MRVLVPFTARHSETVGGAPDGAEWVDVSADNLAYWRTLCDWWAAGEAFMVVEHDVVCRADVLVQFDACPEPWCAFPYDDMCHWECMEAWANTLGCTRFSAELMAAVPDALTSITRADHLDWHNVCDGLGGNLRAAGYTHHWHFPPVRHHHMGRGRMDGTA